MWYSGSGIPSDLDAILNEIRMHARNNGKVFIGCDSQLRKRECIFSTVVCLHGAQNQKGGFYFFNREKVHKKAFPTMLIRLTKEVQKSIDLGLQISESFPDLDIEIHIDASANSTGEKTGKFADMLMGYAKGAGFKCKIKPDAWASNSIADKHSK